MHGLGYLIDEPDDRDEKFSVARTLGAVDVPDAASLRPFVVSVLDQSITNSCVAHAYAQAWRMLERRDDSMSSEVPELTSRLAHYYNSRSQHGGEDRDSGTYIRLCVQQANKLGRAPESAWPFDPGKVNERPPLNVYRLAYDERQASYHRVTEHGHARRDAIKAAIAAGMPVIFGTTVSEAFLRVDNDELIEQPTFEEPIAGGHAMVMVGYNGRGVLIVNSWGKGWGADGFGWLSWEYVQWEATRDIWALNSA